MSDRRERYVVQEGNDEPREVDLATWMELEGRAGFSSRFSGRPGTGSFSDSLAQTQGCVAYTDEEVQDAISRFRAKPAAR